MADTDGDGINDFVEVSNIALGLNPIVADANSVLATLFTTSAYNANFTSGQNSVVNDPNAFSLFTAGDIQDLSADDIVVQKDGNGDVTLTIPIESSTDLVPPFAPFGNAVLEFNSTEDQEFFRFRVAPDPE